MKARVQKFIAQSGYCSRRKAEKLIAQGKVKVNGKRVSLGDQCQPTDDIRVSGRKIQINNDFVYIVMNKPVGYLCTNSDKFKSRLVFSILKNKDKKPGLFTVGRLDKNTSGLLLITNDGQFAQKIIHPSSKLKKVYTVELDSTLNEKHRWTLEKGITLDDVKLAPLNIIPQKGSYQVEIWEGRKRQIRRMFEQLGYEVIKLHRESIGKLKLKDFGLKKGEYRICDKTTLKP